MESTFWALAINSNVIKSLKNTPSSSQVGYERPLVESGVDGEAVEEEDADDEEDVEEAQRADLGGHQGIDWSNRTI